MLAQSWNAVTTSPVLVTGASGYVAGVLIEQLLGLGVTVHGAVRDPSKTDRLKHLIDAADNSPGSIKFFPDDLMQEGLYMDGMQGCSVVFHTASPITSEVEDPYKDMVQPAMEGTKNVLNSATKTPTVKRVIVTSSCAAIFGDACDTLKAPGGVLTEDVINMGHSLDYQPYGFSKTMAEMAAWQIAGSQNQWTMATINPSYILGPGLKYHAGSESVGMIRSLGDGTFSSGVPNFGMGFVDVCEVAQAHIVAAFKEGVTGRHIVCGYNSGFLEVSQLNHPFSTLALSSSPTLVLRSIPLPDAKNKHEYHIRTHSKRTLNKLYPDYPIPTHGVPKFLLYLIGPFINASITRTSVANNVNVEVNFDNTKSKEALGIKYRSLKETLKDQFEQLIANGAFDKK